MNLYTSIIGLIFIPFNISGCFKPTLFFKKAMSLSIILEFIKLILEYKSVDLKFGVTII
jgi:hypothetical protein